MARIGLGILMMKQKHLVLLAIPFLFTQCAVEGDPGPTPAAAATSTAFGQPLTAKTSQGRISIMEGTKPVAFIIPASPNVEETRFINEQQQIVVKSRGSHGPATVQLFDSKTGRQQGKVMAHEIQNDQPAWAAGMGE